ncbi:MAG: extracellular catalytic domain type 1 short-chain-length polyhydroxyalkanoate depolymerase [Bacteroidia bacterium]
MKRLYFIKDSFATLKKEWKKFIRYKRGFPVLFVLFSFFCTAQTGITPVANFGSNPGNLNMYVHVPSGIAPNAPLVVMMHGCTQNAVTVSQESGWNQLSDRHKFYVVYPEQNSANNSSNCFNWFQAGDQDRGQGEVLSIRQMVDYMTTNYSIDSTRIFVTGLSAGACMTNVMLACYPEVFSKGAVMAGAPHKAASDALTAYNVGQGTVTKTPAQWGSLVTAENPSYSGNYPTVAVFHGSSDPVVNINNETEIMKQWTNVHGADQTADVAVNSYNGNAFVTKNVFNDNNGKEVVETFTLSGMGHAVALDTGSCYQKCGKTGTYALQVYFSSTFWAAYFFDILIPPYAINGSQNVSVNQTGVTYSVTNTSGSTYNWTVPSGASIVSGQGTNQITVNFGVQSGYIEVTETQSNNCLNGPSKLYIIIGNTAIGDYAGEEIEIYQTDGKSFFIKTKTQKIFSVKIYNALGEVVFDNHVQSNSAEQVQLPDGIYTTEIKGENGLSVKKIVIIN